MKFLTVLSAALLVSATVSAQRLGGNHNEEAGPYNTGFGIKGGLNIASVYKLPTGLKSEGITSFHFGPYAKLGLSESIALQLEALYSRRGADFEYEGFADEKSKIRLDYIDVPLLFVYNIVGENTWSFMAGPQASLLLTVKDENDKEIDKAQDFNSFDFSGVAGVQFGYKFLRVGARYNLGFLDVLKVRDGESLVGDGNYKNHFGQVYVGVEF